MPVTTVLPIRPGEFLTEGFIEGFGLMQHKRTVAIGFPPCHIREIIHGKRGIMADNAM